MSSNPGGWPPLGCGHAWKLGTEQFDVVVIGVGSDALWILPP